VAVLLMLSTTPRAAGRAVFFRTNDGRSVSALLFEANQRPAPAVVLVPMLGRSKDDWQAVAERLVEGGVTAFTIDLPAPTPPADPKELAGWHTIIGGALDYLFSRPEVKGEAIGVAGASLGANLAVLAAVSDSRIRSLALISPALDYRGVRIEGPFKEYGPRPALLLASRKDPYAARSVRELAAGGGAGLRETQWAEIPAHGTVLLARQPELTRSLVEWFQRTLAVN
jgi:dienelactone hydrolase